MSGDEMCAQNLSSQGYINFCPHGNMRISEKAETQHKIMFTISMEIAEFVSIDDDDDRL